LKDTERRLLVKQNKSVDSLPTDMSDTTESDEEAEGGGEKVVGALSPRLHRSRGPPAPSSRVPPPPEGEVLSYTAWREARDPAAREVLNRACALNVDDLFTLLFTNSKFFYDFQVGMKNFFFLFK